MPYTCHCRCVNQRTHNRNAGARAAWADARMHALPQGATPWAMVRAARSQCGGPAAFWRGYLAALLAMGYRSNNPTT
jgi:hypothetical protein